MRNAHTLWELLASLTILCTIVAVAVPPITHARDRATVRAAASTLRATLSAARDAALTRGAIALAIVDATIPAITIVVNRDTVLRHSLDGDFRSRLSASRDTIRFGPTGRAFGASNSTLILRTGSVAETVTVSRIGRVR